MNLHVLGLQKRYTCTQGFGPLSFSASHPRWIGIVGPNGSGKTTLLKVLAGVEKSTGQVTLNGANLLSTPVGPDRAVLVWQGRTLFPNLSAQDNVNFGRRMSAAEVPVQAYCQTFSLGPDLLKQNAASLSGGEAQRVAILRALATAPKILLLDEPFSEQDVRRKKVLVNAFQDLKRRMADSSNTAVPAFVFIVSHDEEEIMALADDVLLLDEHGKQAAIDTLDNIVDRPANLTAAKLFGQNNIFNVKIADGVATIDGWNIRGCFADEVLRWGGGPHLAVVPARRVYPRVGTANDDLVQGEIEICCADARLTPRGMGFEICAPNPNSNASPVISLSSVRETEQAFGDGCGGIRLRFHSRHLVRIAR